MYGKHHEMGQFILRVVLGLLFFAAGLGKLLGPGGSGVSQFLEGLGCPIPLVFAWILILAEILGGAALIVGFKTNWASLLVGIVIIVAILTVGIKGFGTENQFR